MTEMQNPPAQPPSFTSKAVVTLLVYFIFWLPGLIVNILFLNEAKREERCWNQSLSGVGCLSIMLWVQIVVFALFVFVGLGAVCVAAL